MKRRVFNAITVLSLLLCVAAAVMWVRSYWVVESWIGHLEAGHYEVVSMKGLAGFHWEPDFNYGNYYGYHSARLPGEGFSLRDEGQSEYGTLDDNAVWAVLGFSCSRHTSGNPAVCWRVSAPYWALLMVFGALAVVSFWRTGRIARRLAKGLCANCGYDLRASKDRCPECGTATGGDAKV